MTTEFRPDADLENADWTKQSWDLPPYMSAEFQAQVPDVEAFKRTPAYRHACERGLIIDDEWAGDYVGGLDPGDPPAPPKRRINIHIHRGG